MSSFPEIMETKAEWHGSDFKNNNDWIEQLSKNELEEIDQALRVAESKNCDLLQLQAADFPLSLLQQRLTHIEDELINGRGFVLIRGIPREKYSQTQMETIYWCLGRYMGAPWPQNKHGHLLGDVTDQGKSGSDPTTRGNELGGIPLPYHSDGSDLVGLLCLQKAKSGGTSAICNAVAIHNDLVRDNPDLAAALYLPQPYDFRGEQKPGKKPYYESTVFTPYKGRLYVRYIRPYILSSQRHDSAPRIAPLAEEAMQLVDEMTQNEKYSVLMDLEPGDIQLVNNYHVLHARTRYQDDKANGQVRHLKRLWLATNVLVDRPAQFKHNIDFHWGDKPAMSQLKPN